MKTLIVFASTHGFTEMCAQRIRSKLIGQVSLTDLAHDPHPDLTESDLRIVGGSIHAGRIQPSVRAFTHRREAELCERPLALFLACMKQDREAEQQFVDAFPGSLRHHAITRALVGGAYYFERMNFIQRWVVRRLTGVTQTEEHLDEGQLTGFVDTLNHLLEQHVEAPRIPGIRAGRTE